MSFVTADALIRFGITPDLFGDSESSIDPLDGFIALASFRLRKWVGNEAYNSALKLDATVPARIKFVLAELYLSVCEALQIIWMQGQSGERSVSIEGFRVDLATPSAEERGAILKSLLNRAESLVEEWMLPSGSGVGIVAV